MKLNAPKNTTFLISVTVGIIGILILLGIVPLAMLGAWPLIAAFVLLAMGCMFKGL